MLAEDTDEHRAIFGDDGEAVVYFQSNADMLERARWLLQNAAERQRLANAAYKRVIDGENTYFHRLLAMLQLDRSLACTSAAWRPV
jgi:spore maturation protein CgeB